MEDTRALGERRRPLWLPPSVSVICSMCCGLFSISSISRILCGKLHVLEFLDHAESVVCVYLLSFLNLQDHQKLLTFFLEKFALQLLRQKTEIAEVMCTLTKNQLILL